MVLTLLSKSTVVITQLLQLSYPLHLVCTNNAFLRCLNWCYWIEPNVLVYFFNHILQYNESNNKGQYLVSSKSIKIVV